MKTLFNTKVVPYEEMDDYYGSRASNLKDKYTDFWDGVGDLAKSTLDFIVDVVKGIFDSFVGLVKGLISLAEIISFYNDPLLQADYIYKKITGDTPDFLSNRIEKRESFEKGLEEIIKDPMLLVEGLFQSFSDTYEEEGISYYLFSSKCTENNRKSYKKF